MSDEQSLIIGTVDEIQKLHIRTVPLGETPRRIAHQEQTLTFGVLTMRIEMQDANGAVFGAPARPSASTMVAPQAVTHSTQRFSSNATTTSSATRNAPTQATTSAGLMSNVPVDGAAVEVHNFIVLDQNTFEVVHVHQFAPYEHACRYVVLVKVTVVCWATHDISSLNFMLCYRNLDDFSIMCSKSAWLTGFLQSSELVFSTLPEHTVCQILLNSNPQPACLISLDKTGQRTSTFVTRNTSLHRT